MNLEEPLRSLDAMLRAGKIRYWGVSIFGAGASRSWCTWPGRWACRGRWCASLLQPAQSHARGRDIAGLRPPWRGRHLQPVARGVLTGKYLPGQPPVAGSRAARGDKRIAQTEWREESLQIAQTLQQHVHERGVTLAQFATAWVLAHPAVSSVIAGPRTLAQWQDYAPALGYALTEEDEALVNSLVAPGHPSTPGYNDPAYPLDGR